VGVATADGRLGIIGLRVPGSLGYRHLAIRLVTTACKMALEAELDGADPDFEPEVVSAFGEAFNNVAVHGYRDIEPAPVQIEVAWDADQLAITMIDTGHTFDPETIGPPDLDELPESGMGLFIMRACMDVVDYTPGPPNVLRLVRARRGRDGLLPPEPTEGTTVTGLARDDEDALVTTTPPSDGDRSSHVAVVDAPDDGQRTGHSDWRMKALRSDEPKEISRRR
jgi:serine/threonine-protein kinase RsbW